jgi:hypothetical protein
MLFEGLNHVLSKPSVTSCRGCVGVAFTSQRNCADARTTTSCLPCYWAIPSVSVRASGLFQELICSPLLGAAEDESQTLDSKPLLDVLDIVLSTVSELRDLTQMTGYGCPRSTIPLWSSLIRTLGYACSEDMSVM